MIRDILRIIPLMIVLSGCGVGGGDDLHQWIEDVRLNAEPRIPPVKQPAQFFPQEYISFEGVIPFSHRKLTQALRYEVSENVGSSALISPELVRRKEVLEALPLDGIKMVGSIRKEGLPMALLEAGGLLYQVRIGNYLGQNYGKIVGITDGNLQLREIIQDSIGDWVERMVTLELQETTVN